MSERKLSLKPEDFIRSATFSREGMNDEEMTADLAISSEEPYERWYGIEILDHSPEAVDMSRMNDGAPLLYSHRDHIGVVTSAKLEGKRLRCTVKFSKSALGREKYQDVKDGILTKCSVGYRIMDMQLESETDGVATYRATKWQPYEATLTPMPADPTVGVGRTEEDSQTREILISEKNALDKNTENEDKRTMSDTASQTQAPKIDVVAERNTAVAAERKRVQDIQDLSRHFATNGLAGRKIDTAEAADTFIREGKTVDEFQNAVIRGNFKEVKPVETNPEVGMTKRDMERYSLTRAIGILGNHRALDGLEKEMSDETARIVGRSAKGFFVPQDIFTRALYTNVFSAAGAFVQSGNQGQAMIDLLRNKMKTMAMGAQSLGGLVGNLAIPSQTGGATAYWVPENGTITATSQTVGQVSLTPHRLGAATAFSQQLIAQSSIDVESFVRNDLMMVLALAKDKAVLQGSGSAGEPLGIVNTPNLSTSVTLANAGTITYAEALRFEVNVANNNADEGSLGYLTTPTVRAGTKATAEIAAANSIPVWRDGRVNGYRAETTLQNTSASTVIFGNWADVIVADWAGMEIIVNPYTYAKEGLLEVVMQQLCDVAIRHSKSFSISTN